MLRIENDNSREAEYYEIIRLSEEGKPVFSNSLLEFWNPVGVIPGTEKDYDVGICRIKEHYSSFNQMERHLHSEEIITPINFDLFIPVAPPASKPEEEKIRVIPVHVGEILRLYDGAWHFACGSLGDVPLDYFVFLQKDTPIDDIEIVELSSNIDIGK